MAAPTKIQDFKEVERWMNEGKTYAWMVEEYRRKYNIETTISMWAGHRRRHGFDRRQVRDDNLIPWAVKEEHRYAHPINMLRTEARRRAGSPLSREMQGAVDGWKRTLERDDLVVQYKPNTKRGWFLVPRRKGIDKDLIHEPKRKTTRQVRRD